jgi:hypothetical protein
VLPRRDLPARSRRARSFAAALLLVPAALALASPARAEPPRAASDARSDAEVEKRLAFLQERFDRGTPAAQRWWYSWYGGWTLLTGIQAGMALGVKDRGLRIDSAVGAAFSSLGVIPFGLFPFTPRDAAAQLRALPEGSAEARRRKLARAEHLMEESARTETLGRSFVPHALSGAASLAAGLTLVLAYKRPLFSGLVKLVGGIALSEAQIFTQPTAAIDDWRAYQQQGAAGPRGFRPRAAGPSFTLVPSLDGLGLAGTF